MTTSLANPALKPPETHTRARQLPKVLLHEHLDGGLRVATLLALLKQRGITPAADTEAGLAAWFHANAHAGSLEKYLEGFGLTVAAMASPQAMERVAFEAAEDALADGAVLAEFRIAPLLFEAHGVPGEAVVEALLAGLRRSRLPSGLIVCAMRHLPEAETERAASLALHYHGAPAALGPRVVGFDLAGPEFGYPPGQHARALKRLRDAGLPLTLHAGEADAAERVLEPWSWAPRASATACAWWTRCATPPGSGWWSACVNVACTWRCAPPATCTRARRLPSRPTPSPRCGRPA